MSTPPAPSGPPIDELPVVDVPAVGSRISLPAVAATLVVVTAGFGIPAVLGDSSMRFVADAMIMGLFALSIGFLAGHVGLISIAHGVFYGGAGYTMAIVLGNDLSLGAAVGSALLVSVVLAVVIGAVSLRVPGIGFAIVTLGFGQAAFLLVTLNDLRPLFGGHDGRPVPASSFLWLGDLSAGSLWSLIWLVAVVAVLGLWFLRRSWTGLLLAAIKDNEERVRFSGFGTYAPRLLTFAITGLLAGAAGVLAALDTNYVAPANIYWVGTAFALIAALIGGTGSLAGPFLGAFLIQFVQARFATTGGTNFYLGLIFIVVVAFFPSGVVGVAQARWAQWRQRRRDPVAEVGA